ncbi:MAG: zinc ribbon domain-containing protein [Methanomassiliicoccales archaeon]|nr:zinc ribbon domain-containing protein [Methanomassiliicoccales archaeon]
MAAQDRAAQKAYFCEHCGEYLPPDAKVCPKCGYPIGGTPAVQIQQGSRFLSTTRTASILFLLSGLDGVASGIFLLLQLDAMVDQAMSMGFPYTAGQIRAVFLGLTAFIFVASALTLVAAYLARKHTHFTLVAVCGFFSIFTLGVFFLEASFLGILGLVATFRARHEFT